MDVSSFDIAKKLLPANYVQQASDSFTTQKNKINDLFEHRKCPEEGWSEASVELLLHQIAMMDSNNFLGNSGVGEREARFASNIVARRHYRMGHGIGRSGDIAEIQPKAAGSSLIGQLANSFALDILKSSGVSSTKHCFVVPLATGMSLVLCLRHLHNQKPAARYVLWPRIDQKSCFKCILTAGLTPIIIENALVGDELQTDVDAIIQQVELLKPENILCVLTTTSCFAPRTPDKLEEVAKLCKQYSISHVVNNAYGVQSSKCMHLIQQASRVGRVDVYVQSTDKNFMVPVGGSIIAGFDKKFIEEIGKTYPGRGSGTPSLDLFITLLNLGKKKYQKLLSDRKEMWKYLKCELEMLAFQHGEKLLNVNHNPISVAMSLKNLDTSSQKKVTGIGSMLFTRLVSGTRVVAPGEVKDIQGYKFVNWGSHSNIYPHSYLTAAAAIGINKEDIDKFVKVLDKVLRAVHQKEISVSETCENATKSLNGVTV